MQGSIFQQSLATQREFAELCEHLRTSLSLEPLPARRLTRSFFDTFDWRLYRKGWVLEFDGPGPATARLRGIGAATSYVEQAQAEIPRFAHEFPAGPLRGELDAALGDRALLPLGGVGLRITTYRASDDEGKIIFFLDKEQVLQKSGGRRGRTVLAGVRIRTLQGYRKAGQAALSSLVQRRGKSSLPADPFERCMRVLGRVPGEYSTKLHVEFDADTGARAAIAQILLSLLDIMERNVPGVEADLDTEFLHDFRIAARRSRSLINRVRGVFAGPDLAPFKREFSWLSQITSGQRDLDVILHDLPRFQDEPGAGWPAQLQPLRLLLEEERVTEHARLVAALRSARFLGFVHEWRERLRDAASAPGLGLPVAMVANGSIRQQYRRLLKRAPGAGSGLYSEALHDLRKDGKQLRYLLEAFRPLYPAEELETVIRQLRRLQNTLGDIVDCHVQRTRLHGWRERLQLRPETPAGTIIALDRLAVRFDSLERDAAEGFLARMARFAATENTERLERLFGEAA